MALTSGFLLHLWRSLAEILKILEVHIFVTQHPHPGLLVVFYLQNFGDLKLTTIFFSMITNITHNQIFSFFLVLIFFT